MALFENIDALKEAIVKAMGDMTEAVTANKISQTVGYKKTTDFVKNALSQLQEDNIISNDVNTRGLLVYILVPASEAVVADAVVETPAETPTMITIENDASGVESPEVDSADEEKDEESDVESDYTIPEDARGYVIEATDEGYTVTTPDKKDIKMASDERLLVINDNSNYQFVISDPADVLGCINIFTTEAGYAHFLVKDVASGKHIKNPEKELSTDVVLFISISRHNKAGLL